MQLSDYEQYVLSAKMVEPKKAGFYSKWVRRFLKMELSDQLSDLEKVNQFSESVAVDPDIEDWQEKQARHAVEIYLNLFLNLRIYSLTTFTSAGLKYLCVSG